MGYHLLIKRLTLVVALVTATVGIAAVPAAGDTSGTMVITEPKTTLTANHVGNIIIGADNVTLDCNDHAVKGNGVGDGINIAGRTGITVRNCVINDFAVGLRLQFSDNNVIEDNTANNSVLWGFIVGEGSAGNMLLGNKAVSGAQDGFALFSHDTDDNQLIGNEATGNARYGYITSQAPEGNLMAGNEARTNGEVGFLIQSTWDRGTTLRDNTATDNSVGFIVSSGSLAFPAQNNELTGNTSTNNGNGFWLVNASDNLLDGNVAKGNEGDGFSLFTTESAAPSTGNTLTNNQGSKNGRTGFGITGAENYFEGNEANHNGFIGFSVQNGDYNTFIGNEASHNGAVGFLVYDWPPPPEPSEQSDWNYVDSNSGCHNGTWDAADSTTRGTNTWGPENDFCTTAGI